MHWQFVAEHGTNQGVGVRERSHAPGDAAFRPPDFRNHEASVQAAALGLGITQAVSLASRGLIARGEVKEILAEWSAVGPAMHLVYEKSRMPSARLRAFIEFAVDLFAEQLNDPPVHK